MHGEINKYFRMVEASINFGDHNKQLYTSNPIKYIDSEKKIKIQRLLLNECG